MSDALRSSTLEQKFHVVKFRLGVLVTSLSDVTSSAPYEKLTTAGCPLWYKCATARAARRHTAMGDHHEIGIEEACPNRRRVGDWRRKSGCSACGQAGYRAPAIGMESRDLAHARAGSGLLQRLLSVARLAPGSLRDGTEIPILANAYTRGLRARRRRQ